jgi:hypothetical protein
MNDDWLSQNEETEAEHAARMADIKDRYKKDLADKKLNKKKRIEDDYEPDDIAYQLSKHEHSHKLLFHDYLKMTKGAHHKYIEYAVKYEKYYSSGFEKICIPVVQEISTRPIEENPDSSKMVTSYHEIDVSTDRLKFMELMRKMLEDKDYPDIKSEFYRIACGGQLISPSTRKRLEGVWIDEADSLGLDSDPHPDDLKKEDSISQGKRRKSRAQRRAAFSHRSPLYQKETYGRPK